MHSDNFHFVSIAPMNVAMLGMRIEGWGEEGGGCGVRGMISVTLKELSKVMYCA